MPNNDDLVDALIEEGIVPTDEAMAKLDTEITELVEFILKYCQFKTTRKRLIEALLRRLGKLIEIRSGSKTSTVVT